MTQFQSHDSYLAAVSDASVPYVKPVVKYQPITSSPVAVGERATIVPQDHPATYLNGDIAHTSAVISVGPDGSFETRNTRYVVGTAG